MKKYILVSTISMFICMQYNMSYGQDSVLQKIDSISILKKFGKISSKNYDYYYHMYYDLRILQLHREKEEWDSLVNLNNSGKISDSVLSEIMETQLRIFRANILACDKRDKIITDRLEKEKKKKNTSKRK